MPKPPLAGDAPGIRMNKAHSRFTHEAWLYS
jgi:hypothetical protein